MKRFNSWPLGWKIFITFFTFFLVFVTLANSLPTTLVELFDSFVKAIPIALIVGVTFSLSMTLVQAVSVTEWGRIKFKHSSKPKKSMEVSDSLDDIILIIDKLSIQRELRSKRDILCNQNGCTVTVRTGMSLHSYGEIIVISISATEHGHKIVVESRPLIQVPFIDATVDGGTNLRNVDRVLDSLAGKLRSNQDRRIQTDSSRLNASSTSARSCSVT